jgi:hypothetical protein
MCPSQSCSQQTIHNSSIKESNSKLKKKDYFLMIVITYNEKNFCGAMTISFVKDFDAFVVVAAAAASSINCII